ncbi:MAG: hypothetical protein H6922_03995 [Pseudomonadaceae bacterium]|nr:hypothetical protein [Pseudomonadaceae bacterium]
MSQATPRNDRPLAGSDVLPEEPRRDASAIAGRPTERLTGWHVARSVATVMLIGGAVVALARCDKPKSFLRFPGLTTASTTALTQADTKPDVLPAPKMPVIINARPVYQGGASACLKDLHQRKDTTLACWQPAKDGTVTQLPLAEVLADGAKLERSGFYTSGKMYAGSLGYCEELVSAFNTLAAPKKASTTLACDIAQITAEGSVRDVYHLAERAKVAEVPPPPQERPSSLKDTSPPRRTVDVRVPDEAPPLYYEPMPQRDVVVVEQGGSGGSFSFTKNKTVVVAEPQVRRHHGGHHGGHYRARTVIGPQSGDVAVELTGRRGHGQGYDSRGGGRRGVGTSPVTSRDRVILSGPAIGRGPSDRAPVVLQRGGYGNSVEILRGRPLQQATPHRSGGVRLQRPAAGGGFRNRAASGTSFRAPNRASFQRGNMGAGRSFGGNRGGGRGGRGGGGRRGR